MELAAKTPTMSPQVKAVVAQNTELKQTLLKRDEQVTALNARIQWLERQFKLDRSRRFGQSTESAHSLQAELFNEAEALVDQATDDADSVPVTSHQRKKTARKATISDDMVKQVVEHHLDEAERICPYDQSLLEPIGYEARREINIIPEQVFAVEHRYTKYACPCCDNSIKTADREARISTGLCSPQAAAAVVVNKCVDHLPLYRQSKRYSRQGVSINRATLARWMVSHGQAVQVLVNLMGDELQAYPYQQLDETGLKVLKSKIKIKNKKKGSKQGYLWVQRGGPPDKPVVLYDYDPSRSGQVAKNLLTDFKGCVQTDGYPAYIKVIAELQLSHALCNAHARRGFADAIKAIGDSQQAEHSQAMVAINYYKALYRIEAELREEKHQYADPDQWHQQRLEKRQEKSVPIWKQLMTWADEALRQVRPTSHLGKAVGYLIKHQQPLAVYLQNPLVEIDNNLVENRIRPIALGRRNWLFSDTEHGARATANLYGLVNTAMLNGHNPYTYLVYVFKHLPAAKTVDAIEALLPWNLNVSTVELSNQADNHG